MNKTSSPLLSLFSANLFSLVGNVFSELAVPWFVYEMTGSAKTTAGVIIAGQLPNIIIGLFGGHLIDRFSARSVSLFTDAVNFFAVALIPLLFHLDVLNVVLLGALVFFSKAFDSPGSTARQVMLADLIHQDHLPRDRVNGAFSFVETAADLAAPLLAGLLLTLIGAVYLMVIDAITFALSFLIILLGFGRRTHMDSEPQSTISIWEAWRWLLTTKDVRNLAIYDALVNTVATALLTVSLPVLAKDFAGNATVFGVWMTCFASGTALTTLLYTWLGHSLSPYRLLLLTPIGQFLGLSVFFVALISSHSLVFAGIGLFFFGANLGVGSLLDAKLLQTAVPEDRRGSVFAAFSSTRYIGVPLGIFTAGVLLENQAVMLLLVFFALLLICSALLWVRRT